MTTTNTPNTPENLAANHLRILAVEAVEAAKSGHPGAPLGLADVMFQLFTKHLKHDPQKPLWPNRDRFVLSNGHASALLYATLHLSGYDLGANQLRSFRQLHSQTPGHPEYGMTPGVEVTTGPLGQGLAHAVGMATAEKLLAKEFNAPSHTIVDHKTWVIVGDGCLMEGVSQEAISLAGSLNLDKLIVLWDSNNISIDGDISGWFSEDQSQRFAASGFRVLPAVDGHDSSAIDAALKTCGESDGRPTFLPLKTRIGFGVPGLEGSHKTHGAALGSANIEALKNNLQWDAAPQNIEKSLKLWNHQQTGAVHSHAWEQTFSSYSQENADQAAEFERRIAHKPAVGLTAALTEATQELRDIATIATRKALTKTLEHLMPHVPELMTGSADLAESNGINWSGMLSIKETNGRHIHFGVREFAMTAAASGMLLHGGYQPLVGTFLCFSDYSRPAIRLAALMGLPSLLVFSHDTLHLGEDGPTHQPIEHLAALRAIPNLHVWRPADGTETVVAIGESLMRNSGPAALILSRQNLPTLSAHVPIEKIKQGAYVVESFDGWHNPKAGAKKMTIIATGSEVSLASAAVNALSDTIKEHCAIVSMPCAEVFAQADIETKNSIIPPDSLTVFLELATPSWIAGVRCDHWLGLTDFGASGKGHEVVDDAGFSSENISAQLTGFYHQSQ